MNDQWNEIINDFKQWERAAGKANDGLRATIKAGEAYHCPQCGKHLDMESKPLNGGGRGYRFACKTKTHFSTHYYRTPTAALRELFRRFEGEEKR